MPPAPSRPSVTGRPLPDPAPFVPDLVGSVEARLDETTMRQARRRLHRKAAVVAAWYVASFVAAVASANPWTAMLACTSLGLAMAAVGFNVQHDANHNAFFDPRGSRRLSGPNRAAGWSMYALGASQARWIEGHVRIHHSVTNVVGRDFDIELKPFARLAPQQRHFWWHRAQHLYVWPLYAFTAAGILIGDVVATIGESFTGDRRGRRPAVGDYAVMLGAKGLFVATMVGVPLLAHSGWAVLAGAAWTMAVAGVVLGVVFQLAHAVSEAEFCTDGDRPEVGWHVWQLRASVDFCQGQRPAARAVTWMLGGLNYQTEHHLFPQVPHTAYPLIAPVVREVCDRHGVRYNVHPTLRVAVRSHYRHLRQLGRPPTVPASSSL
jgi:linoleoyl-CoA desaturase